MGLIQLARSWTRSEAEASNRILNIGEPAVALDTGEIRVGDGANYWRDLPAQYRGPKMWVEVGNFGAVGDGVTNDRAAIQATLDFLDSVGGGVAIFQPGLIYIINGVVQLRNNCSLDGNGAEIRKTQSSPYTVFAALSQGTTGWGSGVRDVQVRGFTFRGSFEPDHIMSVNPFALHHASNVLVEDCQFIECIRGGHIADLNGSENIVFRRCTFEGFNPPSAGYNRAEAVQLDISTVGSVSASDLPGSFDGLACRNVVVEHCQFLPLVRPYGTYPSPNPIGGHAVSEGNWYEDIWVTDNLVVDPVHDVATSYTEANGQVKGVMHFPTVRGLRVLRNRVVQSVAGRMAYTVSVYSMSEGVLASHDHNTSGGTGPIAPMASRDVWIEGNTVGGFVSSAAADNQEVFLLRGIASAEITGVFVRHNSITRGDSAFGTASVQCYYCDRPVVDGNTFSNVTNMVRFNYSRNGSIVNNRGNKLRGTYHIYVGPQGKNTQISGNQLHDCDAVGVYTDGTTSDVTIAGNVLTDMVEDTPAVSVAGSQRVVCQGNVLRRKSGFPSTGRAIAIYNATAADVAAVNNVVSGYTTKVGDTSGGTNINVTPNF